MHEVIPRTEEEEKLMEGEDAFTKHCKLIIAKQRSGPTDEVSFKFHKSCVRFETFDYQQKGKYSSADNSYQTRLEAFDEAEEYFKKHEEEKS